VVQYVIACCSEWQCVAVRRSVVQYVAECCSRRLRLKIERCSTDVCDTTHASCIREPYVRHGSYFMFDMTHPCRSQSHSPDLLSILTECNIYHM